MGATECVDRFMLDLLLSALVVYWVVLGPCLLDVQLLGAQASVPRLFSLAWRHSQQQLWWREEAVSVIRNADRFMGNLVASGLVACWTELLLAGMKFSVSGKWASAPLGRTGLAVVMSMLLVMGLPRLCRRMQRGPRLFGEDEAGSRAARRGRVAGVFFGVFAGIAMLTFG